VSLPAGGWRARTFASFARPAFRHYYVGLLFNMAGFWLRIAATAWFAFELTGSRECLGWITMASLLPWVPIAPLAGVWAERVDQRTYLVVVYLAVAAVNVLLGWGILEGIVGWHELVGVTLVISCLRGMELPARHAIVRRLVPVRDLPNAIGLNAAGFHLMNAVGNALAGLMYAVWGPAACFLGVGATSLLMVFQLVRLDLPPQIRPATRKHPLRELADGFRYVASHDVTRTLIGCAAGVVGLLLSFRVLMPAVAKDILGLEAGGYGLLMALSGVGSLAAALWVASGSGGRGRRISNIFVMVWIACGAVAVVAWSSTVVVVGAAMIVAGFTQVGFMASANTTVQEIVPDHLRARVMGIWALIFGAAYPLGGALQGIVAERTSEGLAMTCGASLALIFSLALFATSYRRLTISMRHELRQRDEDLRVEAGQVSEAIEGL